MEPRYMDELDLYDRIIGMTCYTRDKVTKWRRFTAFFQALRDGGK